MHKDSNTYTHAHLHFIQGYLLVCSHTVCVQFISYICQASLCFLLLCLIQLQNNSDYSDIPLHAPLIQLRLFFLPSLDSSRLWCVSVCVCQSRLFGLLLYFRWLKPMNKCCMEWCGHEITFKPEKTRPVYIKHNAFGQKIKYTHRFRPFHGWKDPIRLLSDFCNIFHTLNFEE